MFKKALLTLLSAFVLFTGCSSYPDSAEGVAQAVCNELKNGNFDKLEQYVAPQQKADFQKSFSQAKTFLASNMAKKMFATMNCDKSDAVKEYNEGTKKKFSFGQMKIKVHRVDAVWYFTK